MENLNRISVPKRLKKTASVLFWITLVLLSGLTIWNALPYFDFTSYHLFLHEKGELVKQAVWRTSFYFHITGGMVCLLTGPFLFIRSLLRKKPKLHRSLGKAYVFTVLVWAGPAGLYMCIFAKGGFAAALPFTLMGIGWWLFTFLGYRTIRKKQFKHHIAWMARSYCFALSAVTFRLFQILLFSFGIGDDLNYIASMWLSLGASVVTGEIAAAYFSKRLLFPWNKKSKPIPVVSPSSH